MTLVDIIGLVCVSASVTWVGSCILDACEERRELRRFYERNGIPWRKNSLAEAYWKRNPEPPPQQPQPRQPNARAVRVGLRIGAILARWR